MLRMYAVLESELYILKISVGFMMSVALITSISSKMILIGSLSLPVISPQMAVCTAKVHTLPLVDTSVQVTLVWLVVVGQLPQFDARML